VKPHFCASHSDAHDRPDVGKCLQRRDISLESARLFLTNHGDRKTVKLAREAIALASEIAIGDADVEVELRSLAILRRDGDVGVMPVRPIAVDCHTASDGDKCRVDGDIIRVGADRGSIPATGR